MKPLLPKTPLRRSLAIQARVIWALLMREIITRYGRHNIGFMWLFLEPMLFTLGVMALWSASKTTHGSSLSIVSFAITGYSSILLWRNATSRCAKAIEPNLSLLFHRNTHVIDVVCARLVLEISGATISFFFLTIFFILFNFITPPHDIATVLIGWGLLVWFACALGFIVCAVSERSEVFEKVWHTLTYLLLPLSGALFMLYWMPPSAREFLLWVPMVHGVEMIRHGFYGPAVPTFEDPLYFALCNLILTLFGLALLRETGRRVIPE